VRAESTRGNGQAPLVVSGPLAGGEVAIPGNVSSQYVTALLMAGAVTEEGVEIDLTTPLKSAPYVDITLELLDDFGIEATPVGDGGDALDGAAGGGASSSTVDSRTRPRAGATPFPATSPRSRTWSPPARSPPSRESRFGSRAPCRARRATPRSWKSSSAWAPTSSGDREAGVITVRRSELSGVEVDVGDTPDLLPTIAALGAVADGDTRIMNCEHVRYKETDRVSAMAEELEKLGAKTTEEPDTLTVHGSESDLRGASVDGRADHRIVMALAVAALVAEGTTTIRGGEHVDVSFPNFFDAMADLGIAVERDGAGE